MVFPCSCVPEPWGSLDRFKLGFYCGFRLQLRIPGLSALAQVSGRASSNQYKEEASSLSVWIQIRAFSSSLRSRWQPARAISTQRSIKAVPGLRLRVAGAHRQSQRDLQPGRADCSASGASRLGAPFQRQRRDTNLPCAGPAPPDVSAGGDIQARSAPRAQPLRNSLIRIVFTALWQAIVTHWLKLDPGPSCKLL